MTKKHFKQIACAVNNIAGNLRDEFDLSDDVIDRVIMPTIESELADALSATNPRFDRARFAEACGIIPRII